MNQYNLVQIEKHVTVVKGANKHSDKVTMSSSYFKHKVTFKKGNYNGRFAQQKQFEKKNKNHNQNKFFKP
jgi:hypothetical protein